MTVLPKTVQKQLDAANAIEAAMAQPPVPPGDAPAQTVAALVTPTPAPGPTAAPPAPDTPPQPQPADPAPAKPADFEHKYRVLQGMYESDVKQVKQQLREQNALVEGLSAQLEAMKAAPPTETTQLNEKDIDKFGADLIEMVQRYADQKYAGIEQRLVALEQQVGIVAREATGAAKRTFLQELAALVPDYRAVNADPRWLAWLGETDPMFGRARQVALDEAQQQGDAARVASIFQAFKAFVAPPAPAQTPEPSLSDLVTPPSVSAPPPPPQPSKPRITQKAIQDFYNDVARGRYVGREAEAERLEQEINLALAEGRVV